MTEDQKQQRKEYIRKYKDRNKEKLKAQRAQHYQDNKEFIKKQTANYRSKNKELIKQWAGEYYAENREKFRTYSRKTTLKRYGLTLDQYNEMLQKQDGLCAICKKPNINRALAIDHNHKTNKVRELL